MISIETHLVIGLVGSIVLAYGLWRGLLKPFFVRIFNYLYLYHILTIIRPNDTDRNIMFCASRLITYDQVVTFMKEVRSNPKLNDEHIKCCLSVLDNLRKQGYSESSIFQSTVHYLRQHYRYGFDALPAHTVDENVLQITQYLESYYSTKAGIKPVACTFWLLASNSNLNRYLKRA